LTEKNELLVAGKNEHGRLGNGKKEGKQTKWEKVENPRKGEAKITRIEASGFNTFLYFNDEGAHSIFGCGKNSCGELGIGNTDD